MTCSRAWIPFTWMLMLSSKLLADADDLLSVHKQSNNQQASYVVAGVPQGGAWSYACLCMCINCCRVMHSNLTTVVCI